MQKLHPMRWLKFHARAAGAAVLLVLCAAPLARAQDPAPASDDGAARIRQYVFDMEKAYERVQDYTTTFHKQERVKGRLLPKETIELKFRKPFAVYMRWTGEVNQGREALFVKGWNSDKVRAHKGSFPDMTVNLSPDSSMAMQGNRHPITEAGFGQTIALIARDAKLSELRPQDRVRYVDHGEKTVYGARSRCIEAIAPQDGPIAVYYAARAKICFDTSSKMPTRVTVWNKDGDMLEDYGYEHTRINAGLGDADFDPDNSSYNF